MYRRGRYHSDGEEDSTPADGFPENGNVEGQQAMDMEVDLPNIDQGKCLFYFH